MQQMLIVVYLNVNFFFKHSLISALSIVEVNGLKMHYKSSRVGDVSELLSPLIPSFLNPKFCFRLFLLQSNYDINIFFLLYSLIEIVTIMNRGTICCFEKAAGTMEAAHKWSEQEMNRDQLRWLGGRRFWKVRILNLGPFKNYRR